MVEENSRISRPLGEKNSVRSGMSYKIFFSNIGYAKGIDGSLRQHISMAGRHFYCSLPVQEQVLAQVKALIDAEQPDLCCPTTC